jgi:sensor histidine kinase regulating citrate/malate metabolism
MDNAIEAEKSQPQKGIRIFIESKGPYLHITVQNRIQAPVLVNGKLPDTTKRDKHNHGLGMYSVTETVTQNDGAINIYEKDGWLIIDVLMLCRATS